MTGKQGDNNLGYDYYKQVHYKWIYYSSNWKRKLKIGISIMNFSDEEAVDYISKDILKQATGLATEPVTIDQMHLLVNFEAILKDLAINIRRFHSTLQHFPIYNKQKSKNTKSSSYFSPEELNKLLCCQEVEDSVLAEPPMVPYVESMKNVNSAVFYFIKVVIPMQIFGSNHNRNRIRRFISCLLQCGKLDSICIGLMMAKLKLSHIRWLKSLKSFNLKSKVAAKVFLWIIQLILSFVESQFYITETSIHKNEMFCIAKKTWQRLKDKELHMLLKSGKLNSLKRSQAKKIIGIAKNHSMLYITGAIRFVPKTVGLRPVMQCSGRELTKLQARIYQIFIELVTSELFQFNPQSFSSQMADSMKKILKWGDIYVVKVDIKDAYGSILQDKLIQLLQEGAKRLGSNFAIKRFRRISLCGKRYFKPYYYSLNDDGSPKVRKDQSSQIYVENSEKIVIDIKETVKGLIQLLSCQIIQTTNNQFAILRQGLAQGAMISGALCDLYYSALVHTYLQGFHNDCQCLIRSVDDFLFISPNKMHAVSFLDVMQKGFKTLNCYINNSKTVHNLHGAFHPVKLNFRGYVFCSLSKDFLIEVNSLSYGDPRYSLKINLAGELKKLFSRKIRFITSARWLHLMSDLQYTTRLGVLKNLYRLGISLGARTAALVKTFSKKCVQVKDFIFIELRRACFKCWSKVNRTVGGGWLSKTLALFIFFKGVKGILNVKKIRSLMFTLQRKVRLFINKKYLQLSLQDKLLLSKLKDM